MDGNIILTNPTVLTKQFFESIEMPNVKEFDAQELIGKFVKVRCKKNEWKGKWYTIPYSYMAYSGVNLQQDKKPDEEEDLPF